MAGLFFAFFPGLTNGGLMNIGPSGPVTQFGVRRCQAGSNLGFPVTLVQGASPCNHRVHLRRPLPG